MSDKPTPPTRLSRSEQREQAALMYEEIRRAFGEPSPTSAAESQQYPLNGYLELPVEFRMHYQQMLGLLEGMAKGYIPAGQKQFGDSLAEFTKGYSKYAKIDGDRLETLLESLRTTALYGLSLEVSADRVRSIS